MRERSPYKHDFPTDTLGGGKPYRSIVRQWGRILAREHLRGARALHPDEPSRFARAVCARVAGRMDHAVQLVTTLAESYAQCVRQDHRTFVDQRVF